MSSTRIGRVYKIVARQSNLVYVGSTFNRLSDRWNHHKSSFRRWLADKSHGGCSIYPHFEEHGLDAFQIVLVKQYEVLDRRHLEAYETLWISRLRCVNRNRPFQVPRLYKAAYYNANRDKLKEQAAAYHEANRDQILEKQAIYRESHREQLNEQAAAYREANRADIKKRAAAYREAHRADIRAQQNGKHECGCGGRYTNSNKRVHERTAKHQHWLEARA